MSPFEIFRRNLKPMMVVLTGLALFAFVVLPALQTYMSQNSGGAGEATAASFSGTNLSYNRVNYFTRNHNSTIRFLNELATETIAKGGVPRTAGFQYDQQNKQVQSLGINQSPSTDSTIRTFMLAAEAREAGFDLDDSSLDVWLEQFTDGRFSDGEIDAMLMQSTQNQMGRPHLYEQLRNHLLADVYLRRGYAGLFTGDGAMSMPLMTPAEQWTNFLKLNQKATANAYGFLVSDFLEKTSKTPTESQILATYDEGKDRDFSDQSPDPAFHRRYTAKFEYLVGSYQTFLDEEVAKLPEEQIRAEYERRLKGGDFQLPEDAKPDMIDTTAEEAATEDKPAEDKPAEDKPADQPTEEKPANEQPTEEAAPAEDAPKPEASDQSQQTVDRSIRLVAFQEEAAASQDEPAADTPAADTPAADTPAADTPAADTPAADTPAADTPAADTPAAEPAADAPKDEPAADAPQTESAADAPKDETPKVEKFEDVRETIADELAGPAARARMDQAVTEITSAMRLYGNKLALHESNVSIGQTGEPPARPDLQALAEKYGFTLQSIGPYDQVSISDEPIANSFDVGSQFGQRGPNFVISMYGFDNGQTQLPPRVMFSPLRTADDPAGKIYVSWKVAETQAYTPSLDEVRDEVIIAVRTKEARELARAAAEKLAAEAAGKPLADVLAEDQKDDLKSDLGPFSWMDSFGFSGASIGNVPELDSVGEEFMNKVFTTEVGQHAVAMNQPGRVVYVVTPTQFTPSIDELREQFKQPTNRMMAMFIGNDAGPIISGFFDSVDKKVGYTSHVDSMDGE
jgi:hypothetical protein